MSSSCFRGSPRKKKQTWAAPKCRGGLGSGIGRLAGWKASDGDFPSCAPVVCSLLLKGLQYHCLPLRNAHLTSYFVKMRSWDCVHKISFVL